MLFLKHSILEINIYISIIKIKKEQTKLYFNEFIEIYESSIST